MSANFRQLDYQDRVLARLDAYLDALKEEKAKAEQVAELAAQNPGLDIPVSDFTEQAWQMLGQARELPPSRVLIPYSSRADGCNRPVPNAVLKVPTAGGKTWLAVSSVSRIMGRYLDRNTGFVLWIVPNEAIYTQTLKHLQDRQHPYRQALERAAAGRVKIMEKTDRLNAGDIETNLCVMLLMLQSANRETRDSLKMFQDRGDVHGFFPPEGEQQAHHEAFKQTPNLDGYGAIDDAFRLVKDSLGNALRLIRPLVVLDEGHRAISNLAFATLYGFNPCFVLELTATPQDVQPRGGKDPQPARYANVLVEVTGRELDREGMIKMPLNLNPRQDSNWQATLDAAREKLRTLDAAAENFQANTGRYIRPIMLVQVERTGSDQRDDRYIHAEDVKHWFLIAGFREAEIAIKTAEQNDLAQPENQDLLADTNQVRVIITKQALQEGWDCPFAYILCALAASSNEKAMTQLVGRILRQPDAEKTGVEALDECHIITHHANTANVVAAIKKGLERDGLGDLVLHVNQDNVDSAEGAVRTIQRRPKFAKTQIYLPQVMFVQNNEARELDYEMDILAQIDWRGFDISKIAADIPGNAQPPENQLQRIRLSDSGDEIFTSESVAENTEVLRFDPVHAVRSILDLVPNPFVGREIVGNLLDALKSRGFDKEKIGQLASLITAELWRGLDKARIVQAEKLFKDRVATGHIQFRLRLDGRHNWKMPRTMETTEPEDAAQLPSKTGEPLQKSLFAPVYKAEMNNAEQKVTVYLDSEQAVTWWHRNVARSQYGIQGWKKAKIYPDFIFAVQKSGKAKRITVLETKGDHLDNPDTAYKRDLLEFLSKNFAWDHYKPAGELKLVQDNGETVDCALILMSEWQKKLPNYLKQA